MVGLSANFSVTRVNFQMILDQPMAKPPIQPVGAIAEIYFILTFFRRSIAYRAPTSQCSNCLFIEKVFIRKFPRVLAYLGLGIRAVFYYVAAVIHRLRVATVSADGHHTVVLL